ncbi:uncharacterized protein TNCV_60201 [Trichonephila clavipes]|nr:uncharacterized protein TNCV_60201 [Trichonephila clavipes]
MAAVDFLHYENPSTWAGIKPATIDAFNRGIVGARYMDPSISEIDRQLGFSKSTVSRLYQETMDGGQKTSDRANCKGQLALKVRGGRRLRRIVRSHQSQTLTQITT